MIIYTIIKNYKYPLTNSNGINMLFNLFE